MITLRDYQQESVDAVFKYFERSGGNPLLELPTGAGKSLILAEIVRRAIEIYPPTRVMMLTHVKELVEQNYRALCKVWRDGTPPAGIYSAGLGLREMGDQITYAGIQSAVRVVEGFGPRDLIFVDEAHRIPKAGSGHYLEFLERMRELAPHVKVIGLTATPYRLDGGYLHRGKDRMFTDIAFTVPVGRLVRDGYLSPVIPREPSDGVIDTSSIKIRGGDFAPGELNRAACESHVAEAVAEMVRYGEEQSRKSWLAFSCGIEHAEQIIEEVKGHGVSVGGVFGSTHKRDRRQVIGDFKRGSIRCLVNCDVLTTGFDAPGIDLLAIMRPTESTSLYVQMVGRGLRTAPGKDNCLVLDYGGNVRRHGPIDNVSPKRGGAAGASKVRECPECGCLISKSEPKCPDCEHEFEVKEKVEGEVGRGSAHDAESGTAPIMSYGDFGAPQSWPSPIYKVHVAFVNFHEKEGKPPSMRVTYMTGANKAFSEWVCFEHGGFATKKACDWWTDNGGSEPFPSSTEEAMDRWLSLRKVERITVKDVNGFDAIVKREFTDDELASNADYDRGWTKADSGVVSEWWKAASIFDTQDFDETPF